MRRLFLVGVLVLLSGCQNIVGPFKPRSPQRVDDPSFPLTEQERRGRARYALPDQTQPTGPYSGPEIPNPGRTMSTPSQP
jgi:hypothetical protein